MIECTRRDQTRECFTFITSRGTLDGAYPALILGLNARRMGARAGVFFTFMGIDVIRKGFADRLKFYPQGPVGAIPGMPELASAIMRRKIDGANVPSVAELLEMAQAEGVCLIACRMTMDMLGLSAADLIEGVEVMTAEQYLQMAQNCRINMFT